MRRAAVAALGSISDPGTVEPLLAALISIPLLGEVLTPVQAAGGAIMLAALVAFQLRR